MRHYFINRERTADEYFSFEETFLDKRYYFNSSNDIFSKNQIDEGTKTLLNTVIKQEELGGKVLDLGCGIGVIGAVLLKNFKEIEKVVSVDINETAILLTQQNFKKNDISADKYEVVKSDMYDEINDYTFDYIITNPPIKVGKNILYKVVDGAKKHLKSGGKIFVVIRKDHGADSFKKHMLNTFNNAEVVERNKGYYILKSIKE